MNQRPFQLNIPWAILRCEPPPPQFAWGLCCIFSKVFAQIRTLKTFLVKISRRTVLLLVKMRKRTPLFLSHWTELKRGAERRAPAGEPRKPPQRPCLEGDQRVLSVIALGVSFLFSFSFFLRGHGSWRDGPGCKGRPSYWPEEQRGLEREGDVPYRPVCPIPASAAP